MLTLIIGLLGWASGGPQAQVTSLQTVSPFDVVGFIEAATVTPAADGFSGGGTITVNGTVMTVPTNTLLQMPAFALTWQETFAQAPAPYGPTQSGLAMADLPTPPTTYEIHVQGNRVGDQYIVGLMFIAQQSLNSGVGFINFIDYANAEMRVNGLIGNPATGARVRLNDPLGKFGMKNSARPNALTDNHDDRFTMDEDNPTVRSETGFPMCIPRTNPAVADDPLCPQNNRPKGPDGNYLTIFTMDQVDFPGSVIDPKATCTTSRPGAPRCNPLLMMPFEVGDYVTYNGTLTADATGPYVSAWGAIANVGVLTAPGTQPAYTAIDVMILGTGGIPDPLLPQEAAVRTRIEGFTTDPTSFVDLFATDVDACTGAQSLRYYTTIGVDNLVKLGRWRWRPNTDKAFLPPSRMLTAISENGEYFAADGVSGTPTGLRAGFYTAPNFEFIFPENLGIGKPKVPSNFQDFPFLASGSGPYPAPVAGVNVPRLGPISPWPGAVAPQPPVCIGPGGTAAFSPIADAGINQSVAPFAIVTLDGLNSRDTTQPLPLPLTFLWQQDPLSAGPRVAFQTGAVPGSFGSLANIASPTFTAPGPPDVLPVTLTFNLTVSNGTLSSTAIVKVVVTNTPTATDTITVATAVFRRTRAQLLVTASTSNAAAVLTVEGFGVMGPAIPITTGVPAPLTDRLYRQVGIFPTPATVTIRSSLGGTLTIPVTVR
jgi:hypothetical protein